MKTITKTINVFSASELQNLHPQGFEKALNAFRESEQQDYFWSECIIEDFKSILHVLGFSDPKIYFSGFWSQGDGACFIGKFKRETLEYGKVLNEYPNDKDVHVFAEYLNSLDENVICDISHHGRYYHENSTSFNLYSNDYDLDIDEMVDYETFKEHCRDFMRHIYKTLETEYESLGDVHSFLDYALNNEVLFLENGDIYND